MTSRIGRACTSTSYIDRSSESGSMPCDIVRLPCGSMSMHRTRWPSSAKAAARFSVVVVFATPPFWLANAMTFAVLMCDSVRGVGKPSSPACSPHRARVLFVRRPSDGFAARGGARSIARVPVPVTLDRLLEGKRIVVCGGSGGVGKTTAAAAIAAGMAARGLKVAVVTIDPARRLANALGVEQLGNEPRLVDPERFAGHGF